MTPRRLEAISSEIARLRLSAPHSGDIVSVASRLGRVKEPTPLGQKKRKGSGHITMVSSVFERLRPIQIPIHGSGRIKKFTAHGILAQLEAEDVAAWGRVFDSGGMNGEEG
jgi:hypothetical protein